MDVVEEQTGDQNAEKTLDIGALLVEARENKNLTSQDIAKQMNLTLSVITQIESNEFVQNIPLAFIRGYVRSYAQKVGLDVEKICIEFDRQTQQQNEPLQSIKVVSSFKTKRREMNSSSFVFKLITFLIVTALIAFGGWELWKRLTKPSSEPTSTVNEINLSASSKDSGAINIQLNQPSESNATPPASDVAADEQINDMAEFSQAQAKVEQASDGVDESGAIQETEVDNAGQIEDANQPPVKEKITGPLVSMSFQFSADCWVKVTDANDEVLAIGIKKSGKIMPLEGIAPISVILGEPSAVSIEYQGKAFDLSRYKAGETARIILE